ncbi:hypothetical protein CC1G_08382 [Coprinopsis cinerea okayama7|uniref:Uncharacterized protein n=1 Tax=Coprinopsis cinerea (strain Okayama-7 / 130 / ATCC MYA-4618 / FGSC 9003) TaxID=240176 RepID=A8NAL3_COPC7|nr:hypothetical protein CC1G_08382 [Coprinopsis cinerea okayama7\|eukprot:XP_001831865.1 hypothetical protein CC1G_08382 [Coprinopsis cinerea okayama7\
MVSIKLAAVLPFVASAVAICPGFNFGIGNVQDLGSGWKRWSIYNTDCKAVDSLTTTGNPCTSGTFGCTPPPILFNRYTNSFTGLIYDCRPDSRSGRCGNDVISVCCRNDGN